MVKKIKLLVDATNIKVGGGLQVAVSVIREIINVSPNEFDIIFVVNKNVAQQLDTENIEKLYIINTSIRTLNPFSSSRKRLVLLSEKVDIVFTIFGPPFWGPKAAKHVVGFANAWIVSKAQLAYSKIGFVKRQVEKIKYAILSWLLYDKKRFYITETNTVQQLFVSKFKSEISKITVIPNTLPYIYTEEAVKCDLIPQKYLQTFKLVSVTHNYPHKNLDVISKVGEKLTQYGIDCIFIVTIDKEEYSNMPSDFQRYTYNTGPVTIDECFNLYQKVDALFLPTLLECFSVSYLEAMFHRLPILTSDLDFAHDICKDAAIYFDPLCATDIADKISTLINNEHMIQTLTNAGKKIINNHPKNADKVDMYLKHLAIIANA
jgi:glycosyltransferase involved in cell wall biosynthesis